MNDSVDVKSHVYLRTIAILKVQAEFFFGDSVTEVGSITTTLVSGVGISPRRLQDGVALDATVWR